MNKEVTEKAIELEKKYGSIALVKACNSSLNKLLVAKGLITEEELQDAFLKEIEEQHV